MQRLSSRRRKRKVGEASTLENPPGSDTQYEGPAWKLPEIEVFLKKYEAVDAIFNSCVYMEGKNRWFKPARWSGRLLDLESLTAKCKCPKWVVHEKLMGKEMTQAAGVYPDLLCQKYAKLVIKVLKQNLQLEWWRFKLQSKTAEVNQLQRNWMKSKEAKTPRPLRSMAVLQGTERSWLAGDINKDVNPGSAQESSQGERVLLGRDAQPRRGCGQAAQGGFDGPQPQQSLEPLHCRQPQGVGHRRGVWGPELHAERGGWHVEGMDGEDP